MPRECAVTVQKPLQEAFITNEGGAESDMQLTCGKGQTVTGCMVLATEQLAEC